MGRLVYLRGDPHDETQALMPWYATGQLDAADRLLIDAHLATCSTCREDLMFERRLGAAIRELPTAADERWERMAGRLLDQSPAPRRGWSAVGTAWFWGAQAAIVVLGVGLFASQRALAPASSPVPAYRALGDTPAPATGNLLVMFVPGTSGQSVRATVAATRARLIGGPSTAGAYVLAVAPGDRSRVLATLRARPDIVLAQPIDAPAP